MIEPTDEDCEAGRAFAGMAEADGAVSDGADVPWMIAHEIAKARVSTSRECETCGWPVHWDGYCRECECDVRMTRYGPECVVKGHDHEPSPEELRRWINLEDIG